MNFYKLRQKNMDQILKYVEEQGISLYDYVLENEDDSFVEFL